MRSRTSVSAGLVTLPPRPHSIANCSHNTSSLYCGLQRLLCQLVYFKVNGFCNARVSLSAKYKETLTRHHSENPLTNVYTSRQKKSSFHRSLKYLFLASCGASGLARARTTQQSQQKVLDNYKQKISVHTYICFSRKCRENAL